MKQEEAKLRKRVFKNVLNSEQLEHWFSGEITEIEGRAFWVTYNPRGTKALLLKESWALTPVKS